MTGGYNPEGASYPNHEAFSFAIREAAGQFTILVFAVIDLLLTALAAFSSPNPGSLVSPGFLLFLSVGLFLFAFMGWLLRRGIAHAPRTIRVGEEDIVANFGRIPVSSGNNSGVTISYGSMTTFGRTKWVFHSAGKAAWYEFDPPQVRFVGNSVPSFLRVNRSEPLEGALYLTDANLARVQKACDEWRERRTPDFSSKVRAENEMDDATAAALGEV